MSNGNKRRERILYPSLVILFVLGMQLYSSLSQREMFPFAPFKMYSYGYKGDNLAMIRIFCADDSGQERALSNFRLRKVESYYTTDIEEILEATDSVGANATEKIRGLMTPLRKETEKICTHLRVYKMFWIHFDGQKRDHPTSKELIFEI